MSSNHDDDERFERALEGLQRLRAAHEEQVLHKLATSQENEDDGKVAPGGPPRPLYWHPFYRDRPNLIEWLDSPRFDPLYVPLPRPICYADFRDLDEQELIKPMELERLTLTKQKAAGPAPYVGEPFLYRWNVATDQYGRSVAGEAHIVYPYGIPLYGGADSV